MISFTKEECKEIINMTYTLPGVIRDGANADVERPGENIITSKEIGNVIMFDSSIDHCANKIKEGIRYSMVLWLSIDNFGLNKSLI